MAINMNLKNKLIFGFALLISGILYLKVISPTFNIHIPCIFNKITGLDCPGCGMTRASLSLLDGDIYQAFRWNMLVFILAPLLGIYLTLEAKNIFTKQNKIIMGSMLVLTGLFFILRNLETFSWLAPTYVG